MALLGKSIDLYLMDGTAAGRWQATLSNWNCVTYKIPRGDLKNCDDLPELHAPGVYFLFGRDDELNRQFVYVGEGDDALKRIMQPHGFEKDGAFWTEAIILVTPDNTLDKGKIKYLENRFHGIIAEAKRYIVKNANTPTQSQLPKKTRDLLEEFIMNTKLVMPALGHKALESPISEGADSDEKQDILFFSRNKGKGGNATGKIADDGFWVLKGSFIFPKVASYVPSGIKKLRKQYADAIDAQGILQENIPFGSPSYASTFVCGKNSNGLTEWKTKDGLTLKELNGDATKGSSSGKTIEAKKQIAPLQPKNGELLYLASNKVSAYGYVAQDGFIVTKGSQMSASERASCRDWVKNQRKALMEDGKVVDYTFSEDVLFKSPSAAAACIVGGESNGLIMWKNDSGKKLKDL